MRSLLLTSLLITLSLTFPAPADDAGVPAPKPLYRDPTYDGAADPVLVHDHAAHRWLMFYTNRRANVPGLQGVSWVHGTPIGIAESLDGGGTWKYVGLAHINYGDETKDTYWAPDVLWDGARYHMFVTFVPGRPRDWNEVRRIVHLTSTDLLNWDHPAELKLASDRVIDASICRLSDGTWGMWYNNERDRKSIYRATSKDLSDWHDEGKVVGDRGGEGPKVFAWKGKYWMIVDHWRGLGVYHSDDAAKWEKQPALLLDAPGNGTDDGVIGNHCDVVVNGDRAYLFYFTHPGRRGPDAKRDGPEQRRSSIQVVELQLKDGTITCDRDAQTRVALGEPH